MTRFASISSFREQLTALLKVKRGVYNSVKEEVCNAFCNVPIEQIRDNRDMILISNETVVIKLRLADKKHRLSKSDGYRLIYMVVKNVPLVIFFYIYPKHGPMQQLSIDDKFLNSLLSEFISEDQADTLVFHDINNSLAEI